jgi:ABC-type antimicrobial peptide transport system permease subunit
MEKTLLLTKSNLRKNRGTSIGLFFLMMISSCLIGVSLLIFLDCYPIAKKEAERLNAGDGYFMIGKDIDGFSNDKIMEMIGNDTDRIYTYHTLLYENASLPFGNGDVALYLTIDNRSAFTKPMNVFEVIDEDASIQENYVYLPYQFCTGGGFNIGDTYGFEILGEKYSFKIKGFTNVAYGGCNNMSWFSLVVDDKSYENIWNRDHDAAEGIIIVFDLKENVKSGSFLIKTRNEMLKVNSNSSINGFGLDHVISTRTFMALILAISILVLTALIVAAAAMMLANCISNYIKENMKTLGALKAIGYTGKNIKASLFLWFFVLSGIASVLGIVLSYGLMPVFSKIIVGQMGIPYSLKLNIPAILIPIAFVVLFTIFMTALSSKKISSIQPIVALREGVEAHNFRKNHIRLDKTGLSLNVSLAMKTFFGNMKQNVITFIVTGFMVFICIIALLMYENFSKHLKMELFSTEVFAGNITVDVDSKDDMKEYLEKREDVKDARQILNQFIYYNDEETFDTYIFEDITKMRNKDVCYNGRLPENDNEVVVSGKFAGDYGFEIGDEIALNFGDSAYTYLITGFIQTTNNNGREAILTTAAAAHIMEIDRMPGWFWFDLIEESEDISENKAETEKIIEECKERFGDKILGSLNFFEITEGSSTTFKSIGSLMLVMMGIISAIVIALILFLLIKSLVYHKRKDYGIYKALGYTSGNLMLQTALSFMPAIFVSTVVFSVASYFGANPYISIFMSSFGIMKCNFVIPIAGVVIIFICFTVVSFLIALFETRRIRKIEAYNMLVAE